MTITLTGTGGLFTRLGKLAYVLDIVNTWRGTTLPAEVIDALETLDSENDIDIRAAFADLPSDYETARDALDSFVSALKDHAQALLIGMVDADNPLAAQEVADALAELKRQMLQATTHKVSANTVSATVTQTSLDGDGIVVASVYDARGYYLENLLAEDLELKVSDTTTAGGEQITVSGEVAQSNKLAADWPLGSGASHTLTCVDPANDDVLTNGDFEDFTANLPDSWTADVGVAGTDFAKESSTVYKGTNCLSLTGDGSTLTGLSQSILANVDALDVLAVNLWLRRDGTSAAAGVLTIDLYDGSSVVADEAGTDNSFTIDLTALTTSFAAYSGVFRLPEPLPATLKLRVRLSTALTTSRVVYLDHLGVGKMAQPTSNSPGTTPYLCAFSGASNFSKDDYTGGGDGSRVFKVASANDRACAWQEKFDQFFDTIRPGLRAADQRHDADQ